MWVQSTWASSATSASTSTDMWRTDGYLLRFEPCVLPKMSLFPCHHVVSDWVCVQRTLWFQTPFYCYCAHECATQKLSKSKLSSTIFNLLLPQEVFFNIVKNNPRHHHHPPGLDTSRRWHDHKTTAVPGSSIWLRHLVRAGSWSLRLT